MTGGESMGVRTGEGSVRMNVVVGAGRTGVENVMSDGGCKDG